MVSSTQSLSASPASTPTTSHPEETAVSVRPPSSTTAPPQETINPSATTLQSEEASPTNESPKSGTTTSDKIALGVGIGVGLPGSIAGIATFYLMLRKVLRRRRKQHQENYGDQGFILQASSSERHDQTLPIGMVSTGPSK